MALQLFLKPFTTSKYIVFTESNYYCMITTACKSKGKIHSFLLAFLHYINIVILVF